MAEKTVSAPRLIKFGEQEYQPRFAYPEMCEVVEVAGLGDDSELSGGIAKFSKASIPWKVKYDELIVVLKGVFSVETSEGTFKANPFDMIWLPNGTEVKYISDNAVVFYCLHPASWLEENKQ